MRKQWAIPVLASILILGTLGLSQDVFAQTNAGKILVVDAGSNYLFLIDSSTGARTILSDFSDTSQGPLASNPFAVEIDNSGNILVVDFGFGVIVMVPSSK